MNRTVHTIAAAALAAALWSNAGALAATPATDAAPLILKQRAVVAGDGVQLSDLFANVPPERDGRISDSPAPGESLVLSARQLLHYAKSFGLIWRPRDAKVYAEVIRDSMPVPVEIVRDALMQTLLAQGLGEDVEIEIFNRDLPLFVATGSVPAVVVRSVSHDPRSGRVDATVSLAGSQATPVVVSGRAVTMVSVPVLRTHAMPGDVIAEGDIDWVRVEARRAGANSVTRLEDLIGRTPRRPIAGGQPIRLTDIRPNFVIEKGSLVTMILKSGSMTLTARAEALQRGAVGDVIRVRNSQSRKVLETRVVGPDTVTISGPQLASVN